MRTFIAVVAISAALLAGCGGTPPPEPTRCDDSGMRAASVSACASGRSPLGYCQCTFDYLYDRYTCSDISSANISISSVTDACVSCAPQYGFSTNDCHAG